MQHKQKCNTCNKNARFNVRYNAHNGEDVNGYRCTEHMVALVNRLVAGKVADSTLIEIVKL